MRKVKKSVDLKESYRRLKKSGMEHEDTIERIKMEYHLKLREVISNLCEPVVLWLMENSTDVICAKHNVLQAYSLADMVLRAKSKLERVSYTNSLKLYLKELEVKLSKERQPSSEFKLCSVMFEMEIMLTHIVGLESHIIKNPHDYNGILTQEALDTGYKKVLNPYSESYERVFSDDILKEVKFVSYDICSVFRKVKPKYMELPYLDDFSEEVNGIMQQRMLEFLSKYSKEVNLINLDDSNYMENKNILNIEKERIAQLYCRLAPFSIYINEVINNTEDSNLKKYLKAVETKSTKVVSKLLNLIDNGVYKPL